VLYLGVFEMLNIEKFQLSNGLRVVHHADVSSPTVIINTLYDVGAKDEDPDRTGFAHLFEHLMFGGSINIPFYDQPVQQLGGENNAWTSNDITNYYIILPFQNAETGFWLESDRMLSLDFNQKGLDAQKQVVMEEFKQRNLNQPYGDTGHLIRSMAYKVHPYQWPVIGKDLSHIERVTLEDVKAFFFSHYAPNNAILSVAGNITLEETKRLAEKWFGSIPARDIKRRNLPAEPLQQEPRFMSVERNVPVNAIYKAYHISDRRSPDYYVFDVISDILANGNSARLYQRLVKKEKLFTEVNAYISGDIEPGLLHLTGKLAKNVSFEEANNGLERELEALKTEIVGEKELEKVKNKYESGQLFNEINLLNKANNMAYFELLSQAEDMNLEIVKYRAVTVEQIREKAQKVFVKENGSTLYYNTN
jgi:predicted Zn-dependent peptidase